MSETRITRRARGGVREIVVTFERPLGVDVDAMLRSSYGFRDEDGGRHVYAGEADERREIVAPVLPYLKPEAFAP